MISAGAQAKLAELLAYHSCLEENGLYNLNAGSETMRTANEAQLVLVKMLIDQGNDQAEGAINSAYPILLPAMKIVYSPYDFTGCLEKKMASGNVIGMPAPDMTKTVLIVAALGLGAWWYFSQKK
jgi:uncharacterized radical SAM superfamily Fe-S cluster-containing enzyme